MVIQYDLTNNVEADSWCVNEHTLNSNDASWLVLLYALSDFCWISLLSVFCTIINYQKRIDAIKNNNPIPVFGIRAKAGKNEQSGHLHCVQLTCPCVWQNWHHDFSALENNLLPCFTWPWSSGGLPLLIFSFFHICQLFVIPIYFWNRFHLMSLNPFSATERLCKIKEFTTAIAIYQMIE